MRKGKALRLAGFIGASCASVALIATAVETTGAYFSSSSPGSLSASSGHLRLSADNTNLNFANLMPGDTPNQKITYSVDVSSGTVDVWMVFDKTSPAYQLFTGGKYAPNSDTNATGDNNGLGRYGYFAVADNHAGTAFQSGNLQFADTTNTPNTNNDPAGLTSCSTNPDGRGGNGTVADAAHPYPALTCGVPDKILLASNLPNSATGTVTVTFGLNGYLQTQQNQSEFGGAVPFTITATQHNQRP
jgi:hypothetical protein